MLKHALAAALAAGLVAAQPAPAPDTPKAGSFKAEKKAKTLVDLTPDDVDARRLLAPPWADGSPRAVAELAELHRTLAAASPQRIAQARWDGDHEDPSLFVPTLGPRFDLSRLPATAALLSEVQEDSEYAATAAKRAFPRLRPWAVDRTITACEAHDKPPNSYPSGHATLGWSLAMTLALVLPEREAELMARADDYAFSRELCGAHFPSDTAASHALAATMVAALDSKPAFRARLTAARSELVAAGLATRGAAAAP